MINWRQLYNESQAIQPDDTNVPTERICRLVNIYKNDMIEQDLHRYALRLSKFSRSCQICTPKSYTIYKWVDTYISGDKNLFDFRLSGRSVSAFVYYWNKRLFEMNNKRGQLSDFQRRNNERKSMIITGNFSVINLSNIDENIFIKKPFFIPIISHLLTRFQMYYTYRQARSFCSSIQVHTQPMKTFRYLFQMNICPVFICFINEDNHLHQLFWIFRHLITIFNWPLTTKIFSNRSFETKSIFERMMIHSLGFIDLSDLNQTSTDLFSYLYRCLKTCQENGPIIFLFDQSTIFKPKSSDYFLMAFLCDLIRFDLSIPDLIVIPTCLYKSNLSFNQPYLFKELVDSFMKKFNIEKQLCQLIQIVNEQKIVYQYIDCIFRHIGYDVNQLITTRLDFQHIIAAIELCQITNLPSTIEIIYSTLQNLLKTCSFIMMDNHQWNKITEDDIRKFKNIHSKSEFISIIRKEYFLDIIIALTILSKIEHHENISRLFEHEMFNQLKFLLFIFDHKQYLNIRPCQNLQHIIQHCQMRNYISPDYIPQKSMTFRDTILSDHEWSDDDDDELENGFLEHSDNEDEILINNLSNKIPETLKSFYRINYQENLVQLKFFARLFGSLIETIILILKHHIDKQFNSFSNEISSDILSIIRRAYAYQFFEHLDESFELTDEEIYPLSNEKLVSLHAEFLKLFNCLI